MVDQDLVVGPLGLSINIGDAQVRLLPGSKLRMQDVDATRVQVNPAFPGIGLSHVAVKELWPITISVGANGSSSPGAGVTQVQDGDDLAIEITASGGYAIQEVLIDSVDHTEDHGIDGGVSTSGFVILANVAAAHTVAISFVTL